jgi:predicted amidohydrolase YtcJ
MNATPISWVATAAALTLLTACRPADATTAADAIYHGGTIITVNDSAPSAEALAVKDGLIVAVGAKADVLKLQGASTTVVDLAGKTLIPGFVDAHSHFSVIGLQAIAANLLPAPDGPVNDIPALQKTLREFIATSPMVKAHRVVIGMNYDDSQLAERRHPTRQELDAVSTEMPLFVIHQSGHLGVYNSKALELMGINASTPNPSGGVIEREADGKTPSGVLQENAHFGPMYKLAPKFSPAEVKAQFQAGEASYIANGFTTAQEGKTDLATLKALPEFAASGAFKIDIVAYADIMTMGDDPILHGPMMSRRYTNHVRLGGVKLTFDGSPQGKTAWFTQPYLKAPPGEKASYAGYPAFTDAEALKWYTLAYQNNWQMLTHANGDAAIDQLITTVRAAQAAVPGTDRRTVLIHGQFLRNDQVSALQELGIFPALYPMHTFYWGDYHRESVAGPARAANISPTGWLLAKNMMFTIQSDAPVTFPNSMRIFDSAVNRTTRSGVVLGPEHRITPMQALKAMTLWSAYQHFEEDTKGSLQVGKRADLVILDRNPLTVEPSTIKDIAVLETIKDGTSIYRRR